MDKNLESKTWYARDIFEIPINGTNISTSRVELRIPQYVEEKVIEIWNNHIEKLKSNYSDKIVQIKPSSESGVSSAYNSLYVDGKKESWPGLTTSLQEVLINNDCLNISLAESSYPYIFGLQNEFVSSAYKFSEIEKPTPAFGVTTMVISKDNYVLMTNRDGKADVFPNRMDGVSGQLRSPTENIILHQVSELKDEVLLEKFEYSKENFYFTGIVRNKIVYPDKPDLVGFLNVNLKAEDIYSRFQKRPIEERPVDVANILFISATKKDLANFLIDYSEKCITPSASGALVLYGRHLFGQDWAKDVLKKI